VTPDTVFLSIITLIAAAVVLYLVWSNRHHREHRDLKRALEAIPKDLGRAIAASESLMGRIETRLIAFERAEDSRHQELLRAKNQLLQTTHDIALNIAKLR
jgi:hypothetical protein